MINIENEIFTECKKILTSEFEEIRVSSTFINAKSKFPAVSIIEMDNSIAKDTIDSSLTEKYADIVYDVNSFSNKSKQEAKKIAKLVDEYLISIGFTRKTLRLMETQDINLHRYVGRYTARVSKEKKIYRSK